MNKPKRTSSTSFVQKSFCILLSLLLFAACHPWDHPVSEDDNKLTRTILVYMVAENSLSYGNFHMKDLSEIVAAQNDIPESCQLLIYVDDTTAPRLYALEHNSSTETGTRLLKQWDDDLDSCDPNVLSDLMKIVTALYPSKGYGLVFWSHGNAWLPATRAQKIEDGSMFAFGEDFQNNDTTNLSVPDSQWSLTAQNSSERKRTIGIDNEANKYTNTGSKMEISELRQALEGFPMLDFLMFDACFMQTIEVAYELRNVAHYIIASPAEIPNPGAPYDCIVAPMCAPTADVEAVIDEYYSHYADSAVFIDSRSLYRHGAVLSVVDGTAVDDLQTETKRMIERYASNEEDTGLTGVLRYFPLSLQSIPEYFDMKSYMRHIITSDSDWEEWLRVFNQAVPYRRTTPFWFTSYTGRYMYIGDEADFGGISMFVPQPGSYYETLLNQFKQTSWYAVSGWPTFFP